MDGQHFAGAAVGSRKSRLDRRQLIQIVHLFDDSAGCVVAARAGGEEAERGGLADHRADLELGQFDGAALFHPEGRQADGANGRGEPGDRRRRRLHADVVGASRASADANSATATRQPRVRGAERHRQVERGGAQQLDRCPAFGAHPAIDERGDPLLERCVLEHAAVEEDGGRVQEGRAWPPGQGGAAAAQECGEMPGDRGILSVRQTERGESGAPLRARCGRDVDFGKEGIHRAPQLFLGDLRPDRPADQAAAPTRDRERSRPGLLGGAASVREGGELPGIELRALRPQLLADDVREREVDVVASEQDVVSDSEARQRQPALVLADRDQREVAGAATDVDHQDHIARPDMLAPFVSGCFHPRVQRGLRLFEKREAR